MYHKTSSVVLVQYTRLYCLLLEMVGKFLLKQALSIENQKTYFINILVKMIFQFTACSVFCNLNADCYHPSQSMLNAKNKDCSSIPLSDTRPPPHLDSSSRSYIAFLSFLMIPAISSVLSNHVIKLKLCKTYNAVLNLHLGSFSICHCVAEHSCFGFQTCTEVRIRPSWSIRGAE